MTNYLYNLAFRLSAVSTIISNLNYNLMTCNSSHSIFSRNINVLSNLLIIRKHISLFPTLYEVLWLPKISYNLLNLVWKHLYNSCFLTLTCLAILNLNKNHVMMKSSVNLILRNKVIFILSFNFNEAKTSIITYKVTFYIMFLCNNILALLGYWNLSLFQ